jgi:hypothetical protein
MPQKQQETNDRPEEGRPVQDSIRAALRTEGLLVPQTFEEVRRFEEELARNPVEVPAHLLTAEWLFGSSQKTDNLPPSATAASPASSNLAMAAREGSEIPEDVANRMLMDRAKHEIERLCLAEKLENENGEAVQFATASRLSEVAELAEWIAQEVCPAGVVDPVKIAGQNAIGLSFNDYEEAFDGLLEHRAGRFHIYCNLCRVESQGSDRARFTLAHELGHFYIDAHRRSLEQGRSLPLSQCEYESAQPIEQEADCFAAHLLMPSQRFVKQARGMKPGLPTILSLRKHFRTSVTSTACRYADLGLSSCVVVKWSKSGFAWRFMSAEARESGLGSMIRPAANLPKESPTARAIAGETPPASGFFETGTTAATWFRAVSHNSFRNVIMIEQAIPLGRFGTLTVLYPESGNFTSLV